MQLADLPIRSLLLLGIAHIGFLLSACSTRETVTDLRIGENSFGALVDAAPVVVIAETGPKVKVGRLGSALRDGRRIGPPVQKYRIKLAVRKVLRGEFEVPARIYFWGYESEGNVLIGPPQGICGKLGDLGIYFLVRSGRDYRAMVDVYRYWIWLDPRTNLEVVAGRNLPESIWCLLVHPFVSGVRSGREVDFGYITEATGYRLGRARVVRLLEELAANSRDLELKAKACLVLNEAHRGCGGEDCLSRLLTSGFPGLDAETRQRLQQELDKVPRSNELVRDALRDGSVDALARWAYSRNSLEISRFLDLLSDHPDPEIRRLANRSRARQHYP